MKKWYKSRTIRIAILQGIVGVVMAFTAQYPELEKGGIALIIKSMLDFMLRYDTDSGII